MMISTRLGGIVSAAAAETASSAAVSPSRVPRSFVAGARIGPIAAMSAALAPEMPETRYIAHSST